VLELTFFSGAEAALVEVDEDEAEAAQEDKGRAEVETKFGAARRRDRSCCGRGGGRGQVCDGGGLTEVVEVH
jgi:hypothetical protein